MSEIFKNVPAIKYEGSASKNPLAFKYYDANKEIIGWNEIGFDDSKWNNAIEVSAPKGVLREGIAEPIKVSKKLEPIRILKQNDGYIYDFGENNSGVCTLNISAYKGQKIELWYGEELKDGNFDNTSTIFDRPDTQFYKEYGQKDIYIAKGDGVEEYTDADDEGLSRQGGSVRSRDKNGRGYFPSVRCRRHFCQ